MFAPPGGPPGAPIQWGDEVNNENVKAGFGFLGTGNFEEILCYFYHSDQLGSTSYITNASGEVTQFVSYLPSGEIFTEKHSGWDSPLKFNAKELDTETGLYYFGARYYDPKTATWISPDPFAEKYPELSPYVYCHDNPVIFTDPDGKAIWITDKSDNNGKIVYTIHLTGKLINSTDKAYSPEKLQEYASRIKSSIESTYQGKGDGISWNTVVHIAVATENTPGTSDHEFKIVSKGKIPTGTSAPKYAGDDAKGRAPGGGKLIYISEDITESKPTTWFGYKGTGKTLFGGPTLERTAAHEFGHSAGLWHNWTEGNIMAPTIDKEAGMKIKADQFEQIRTKYRKGELNNSESK
ncbi:MAG TPA: RHS repeat-associated core domain-containing protein [Bacteroidales bacterium]|nr:RHS repeat-associated core domain-containing protein [Bacteroidales bacterium]